MRSPALLIILQFSIVSCGPCPGGYSQAPNGGDCFKTINFHDSFSGNYFPASFDEANTKCSDTFNGGLLASIHSPEENNLFMSTMDPNMHCDITSGITFNIGLRCKGKTCKWDDGSPVIYTNFAGDGPSENDGEACYTVTGYQKEWSRKSCGQQPKDCWVCKVKARTIECGDWETEYKGGCVSVHTTPLDQKSAEASCPGGGHLVSIHGYVNDNNFYKNAALNAGINGTVYIGGLFTKGVFGWIDESRNNYGNWANGFPNIYYGDCVQMFLDSSFGLQGQWTNVDCSTKQPFICFRDGAAFDPTPLYPKADKKCPADGAEDYYLMNKNDVGNVYSPNYPLSIPSQHPCSYYMETVDGSNASIKFTSYDCQSGCSLSLFNSEFEKDPFITFTSPVIDQYYSSTTKYLMMVFTTNRTTAPVGTGWEAKYTSLYIHN